MKSFTGHKYIVMVAALVVLGACSNEEEPVNRLDSGVLTDMPRTRPAMPSIILNRVSGCRTGNII